METQMSEQEAAGRRAALDDIEVRIRNQAAMAPVGSTEWRAHYADLCHIEAARIALEPERP